MSLRFCYVFRGMAREAEASSLDEISSGFWIDLPTQPGRAGLPPGLQGASRAWIPPHMLQWVEELPDG